ESSALLDEVTPRGVRRVAYAAGKVPRACARLPLGLRASSIELGREGTRIALEPSPLARRLGGSLSLRVLGAANADNALAAALAARVVVTNDNPRSEDPFAIVGQIAVGLAPTGARWSIELDRARAIRQAIRAAAPGDAVLIAGKGHEREQIIGARKLPFSD